MLIVNPSVFNQLRFSFVSYPGPRFFFCPYFTLFFLGVVFINGKQNTRDDTRPEFFFSPYFLRVEKSGWDIPRVERDGRGKKKVDEK